jgi:hypothetical protein
MRKKIVWVGGELSFSVAHSWIQEALLFRMEATRFHKNIEADVSWMTNIDYMNSREKMSKYCTGFPRYSRGLLSLKFFIREYQNPYFKPKTS